jgi:hypothetical protein
MFASELIVLHDAAKTRVQSLWNPLSLTSLWPSVPSVPLC